MQYLVSVIHDRAELATADEMAAIEVFNERLQAEGHWVFAGGLAAPSTATVIDNRGGEALVTDGWKVVWDREANAWSLFSLADDPGDAHDRARAEPARLRELQRALRDALDRELARLE